MNALYLRRRSKVMLPEGAGATPLNVIATLQKNLEALGFLLAEDVVEGLKRMSPIQVDVFYQRLVKGLRVMVGTHRPFEPMYPNFPAQVMEMRAARKVQGGLFVRKIGQQIHVGRRPDGSK